MFLNPHCPSYQANIRNAPTPPPAAASPMPVAPSITSISNPYAAGASAAAAQAEGGFDGAAPRERVGRSFRFNPKGKYVHIANQIRQEQQLEELKQRIAQSARKAGLDTEFETLEKNIKVRLAMMNSMSLGGMLMMSHRIVSARRRQTQSGGTRRSSRTRRTTTSRWAWTS
jgi:hypothetical protein